MTVFKAALGEGQEEVRVATVAFWTFVSLIFIPLPSQEGKLEKEEKTPADQWLEQQQEEAGHSPSQSSDLSVGEFRKTTPLSKQSA